jgi:hypothetical protein
MSKVECIPARDFDGNIHLSIYGTMTLCGRRVWFTEMAKTKVNCASCKRKAKAL